MPRFDVEALDAQGTPRHEVVEGESAYAVITASRAEGLHVYSVKPHGWQRLFARPRHAFSAEELGLLSEQLASLVEGGLPLAPGLKDLAQDLQNRRLERLLREVQLDLERGSTLEQAFGRHADRFPPIFLSLLRAGEQTGNLPAVMRQLTDYTQGLLRLKYRLQAVLAYPAVLAVFLILFFGLFVCNVVPQFKDLYDSFGHKLPGPTLVVFWLGWVLAVIGFPLLVLTAFLVALVLFFGVAVPFRSEMGYVADSLRLRLPFFGRLYRTVLAGRFCRTLGILLSNGANVLEALHLAGAATGNRVIARRALVAATHVGQGEPVTEALSSMRFMKHSLCWILKHGERHGLFEETLLRAADRCDHEAERQEQHLLGVLGPAMIWLFGLIIGFIVTALYMPIMQLSRLVAL
ncbi:MAG: type II secretion system F family protein [Candidatus Hydrogenedentes bacterium]|nr:type II secretion system F family protein [Candidatus Hydrogenedentota bacterium]